MDDYKTYVTLLNDIYDTIDKLSPETRLKAFEKYKAWVWLLVVKLNKSLQNKDLTTTQIKTLFNLLSKTTIKVYSVCGEDLHTLPT